MIKLLRLPLPIALAVVLAGCSRAGVTDEKSSITVRLPQPRPAAPAPAFSLAVNPIGGTVQEFHPSDAKPRR